MRASRVLSLAGSVPVFFILMGQEGGCSDIVGPNGCPVPAGGWTDKLTLGSAGDCKPVKLCESPVNPAGWAGVGIDATDIAFNQDGTIAVTSWATFDPKTAMFCSVPPEDKVGVPTDPARTLTIELFDPSPTAPSTTIKVTIAKASFEPVITNAKSIVDVGAPTRKIAIFESGATAIVVSPNLDADGTTVLASNYKIVGSTGSTLASKDISGLVASVQLTQEATAPYPVGEYQLISTLNDASVSTVFRVVESLDAPVLLLETVDMNECRDAVSCMSTHTAPVCVTARNSKPCANFGSCATARISWAGFYVDANGAPVNDDLAQARQVPGRSDTAMICINQHRDDYSIRVTAVGPNNAQVQYAEQLETLTGH